MLICRRVLVLLILSCFLGGVVSPLHAGKNAGVERRQELGYTFEDALSRVAREESVCIVAEASPYDANLTKAELDGLFQGKQSAWERIGAIATRFDYSVKQRGRLYILLKRYSSPRDLPDLTVEECFASFDNILLMMESLQPSRERFGTMAYSGVVQTLYVSLSEEQRALLKAGTLRANTLSSEQQEWVATAALRYYFDGYQGRVLTAREECLNATRTDATLARLEPGFPASVMWTAPKTDDFKAASIRLPKELIEKRIPLVPGKESRFVGPRRFLYSIPNALNHCSDSGNGGAMADPRIAAKRVTLVGGQFIKGVDLVGAVADIYGLRVKRDGGKVLLTLPEATQKPKVTEIVPTMRGLLPGPVVRALHLEELDRIQKKMKTPETEYQGTDYDVDVAARRLTEEERAAQFRYLAIYAEYYETAIQRLCQRMDEYQRITKREEVPVAALKDERGRLLANLLLWKSLAGDNSFLYALPASITAFDSLYLHGGPKRLNGYPALGISFLTRDPSGTRGSGWGGTIYRLFGGQPAYDLVDSQLPPMKPRSPAPKP